MESEQTPLQPITKTSSNDLALLSQPEVTDFAANAPTTRLNLLPICIQDPNIEKSEGKGFEKLQTGFFGRKHYDAEITYAGMMQHSNQGVLILPEDSQFAFFSSLLPSSQATIDQSKEQMQCIILQKNPNSARKIIIDPQKDSKLLDKVPRDWDGFDVKKDSVLFFNDDEKAYVLQQKNNNGRSLIVHHTTDNQDLFDATNTGYATALQIRREPTANEFLQTTNLTQQKIEIRYFDQARYWADVPQGDDQYKHIHEELTAQGIPKYAARFLRKPNAWEAAVHGTFCGVELSPDAAVEAKILQHWSDWITHNEDSPAHEILAERLQCFSSHDPDKNNEFHRACVEYLPQEYSIIPTTDRKGLHPKKEEHWGSVTQERPDAYQQVSERVGYEDLDPSAVVGVISLRKNKRFPPWGKSETSYAFSDPSLQSEAINNFFLDKGDTRFRISETRGAHKNATLVIDKVPGKLKENKRKTIDQSARPQSPSIDHAKLLEQAGAKKNKIQGGKGHSPSQGRV